MSGRGRGGGGGGQVARQVANQLGIARHEMSQFSQPKVIEQPKLYPNMQHGPVPLVMTPDVIYVFNLKLELDQRFRESPFYLEQEEQRDISRYTDKYSVIRRGKLELDMSRVPTELVWHKTATEKAGASTAKRRKMDDDETDEVIGNRLKRLEEAEARTEKQGDHDEEKAEKDDEEEGSEKSDVDDAEPISEEDFAEEDNDYISNYFDNGEGYNEAGGSDDNLDADEY